MINSDDLVLIVSIQWNNEAWLLQMHETSYFCLGRVAMLRKMENLALELAQPPTGLIKCLSSSFRLLKSNGFGAKYLDLNSSSLAAK